MTRLPYTACPHRLPTAAPTPDRRPAPAPPPVPAPPPAPAPTLAVPVPPPLAVGVNGASSPAKRAMYRASKPALVTEQPRAVCGATESSNTRSPALSVSSTDVGASVTAAPSTHDPLPFQLHDRGLGVRADHAAGELPRVRRHRRQIAIPGAELTERPAREDRRLEPLRRPERGARGRAVGVVAEKPDLHDRLGGFGAAGQRRSGRPGATPATTSTWSSHFPAGPSVQLTPGSSLITCVGLGGAGALSTATMVSPPRGSDATTVRCPV